LPSLVSGLSQFTFFSFPRILLPQVSHDHKSRSLVKELFMATLSSLLLGCGTLFLTLWAGVFV